MATFKVRYDSISQRYETYNADTGGVVYKGNETGANMKADKLNKIHSARGRRFKSSNGMPWMGQ